MSDQEDERAAIGNLLRSGNASRLRRRGALRIEHTSNAMPPHENIPYPSTSHNTNGGADPDPDENEPPPSRRFRLYCGAIVPGIYIHEVSEDEKRPYPLPSFPPRNRRHPTNSSGCGTLLHASVTPSETGNTWNARGGASDVVVPLEDRYFETANRRERKRCGCIWDGVGCRICGSPLGTYHLTCRKHSPGGHQVPVYTFSPQYTTSDPPFEFPEPLLGHSRWSSSGNNVDHSHLYQHRRRPLNLEKSSTFDPDGTDEGDEPPATPTHPIPSRWFVIER